MAQEIINRVANSPLVSLDLDEYMDQSERTDFDLKDGLFEGVMLREKHFRDFIKTFDWSHYQDKNVRIHCSEETIIPTWAYMLVASKLQGVANIIVLGSAEDLEREIINYAIKRILEKDLHNAKVVIKGCGDIRSRDYAYFQLTKHLLPIVSSIMYGEPCSTVPVFKRK